MAMRDRAGMTTHKKLLRFSPFFSSLSNSASVVLFFFGGDELLFKWTLRILPPYLDSAEMAKRATERRSGRASRRRRDLILIKRRPSPLFRADSDRFVWLQTEARSLARVLINRGVCHDSRAGSCRIGCFSPIHSSSSFMCENFANVAIG